MHSIGAFQSHSGAHRPLLTVILMLLMIVSFKRATSQPTSQPSSQPTQQPLIRPSAQPSMQPSAQPNGIPTRLPSSQPSHQPSTMPTSQPSSRPSSQPSMQPSAQPFSCPTSQPSAQPVGNPTSLPTGQPSEQPTCRPTSLPSTQPTGQPSDSPSRSPSIQPSCQPSASPSVSPSTQPSDQPSLQPSEQPNSFPTAIPTSQPSFQPSTFPSTQPSSQPTFQPIGEPSTQPTGQPSTMPSVQPSAQPLSSPSAQPTSQPSRQPSTQPTAAPSSFPSALPSTQPSAQPSSQPSGAPTVVPTGQPSTQPTSQPSRQPSTQPTAAPSSFPSALPSTQPSAQPSSQPSGAPTVVPTGQPSIQPSTQPTSQPTTRPSQQPSCQPSCKPSSIPSSQPSARPSNSPSSLPSSQPSVQPSNQPSCQPSAIPSGSPSSQPSSQPSIVPSVQPSNQPSQQPQSSPTGIPSSLPSSQPSTQPISYPSAQPSIQPSCVPTGQPSSLPTVQPSQQPFACPTAQPSSQPTSMPTVQPSAQPSSSPSVRPSTSTPSSQPSSQPSRQPFSIPSSLPSSQPTVSPSGQPSCQPSGAPSGQPSAYPSSQPSSQPTINPSTQPTSLPSGMPSTQPSVQPSVQPTLQPSCQPSAQPTFSPTGQPSAQPSSSPSSQPTSFPSASPSSQPSSLPSTQPTSQPTSTPTSQPSNLPSNQPSAQPSHQPSSLPSGQPSSSPTSQPSALPTAQPSMRPSMQPSSQPTAQPSSCPTTKPSVQPTTQPSIQPSSQPTAGPSCQPSMQPSGQPSRNPTVQPSQQPSVQPSQLPTYQPSSQPSNQPSSRPTGQPSVQPSSSPSSQPSRRPTSQPSCEPSTQPSHQPSCQPSVLPTKQPTCQPTGQPTRQPSIQPSEQPSSQPSIQPSKQPTSTPSSQPSLQPSNQPSTIPSMQPTVCPSNQPSSVPSQQPTTQPSLQPTSQPSSVPSCQPTSQPSRSPTMQPSTAPTVQPTVQPSSPPSVQPTVQPSKQPSGQPSSFPTVQPSAQPSAEPSGQPSSFPTTQPSMQPTSQPTQQPSVQPTCHPSVQPTVQPTIQPSDQPSTIPSVQPSIQPTCTPSCQPSSQPSAQPTGQPSTEPTAQPTSSPSSQPSSQPTLQPSCQPSVQPSAQPTSQPSRQPSSQPSMNPSTQPSSQPTNAPSVQPSTQPSQQPTYQPSSQPTRQPSFQPSIQPSNQPSSQPTVQPSNQPTCEPTAQPSRNPSSQPSAGPTQQPSMQPTQQPSIQPSCQPTAFPSMQPSGQPTNQPSEQPSAQPSFQPSIQPSAAPSSQPTEQPTSQPTGQPSTQPSLQPSTQPSRQPSLQPSSQPTMQPSTQPTGQPTCEPSHQPSSQPSSQPTHQPTTQPSTQPSRQPSTQPTCQPSSQPSTQPSAQPSVQPSNQPTGQPSNVPSRQPSGQPTNQPSSQPTSHPTCQPSSQPSFQPTIQPTSMPSGQPSTQPTSLPTAQPTSFPSVQPSVQPSSIPSCQPSNQPSRQPTVEPSGQPTAQPSSLPTNQPTTQPSTTPTGQPSTQPTASPSCQPSTQPTGQPSTSPTVQPTSQPTAQPSSIPSSQPSSIPSSQPSSLPTCQPTCQPSDQPSAQPSRHPSAQPSAQPTCEPTGQPSGSPSMQPTAQPTQQPSSRPSPQPTSQPSDQPTTQPSSLPSSQPSATPTVQPSSQPSSKPTAQPSSQPSVQPSSQPSTQPSMQPSSQPSSIPTQQPSSIPTCQPTSQPSSQPTCQPSGSPSRQPTSSPTTQPTAQPSSQPTSQPSSQPTAQPSSHPTVQPSGQPTNQPSSQPTQPTSQPSTQPSAQPSSRPTCQPSSQPSNQPSDQPSSQPSTQPTGQPSSSPSLQPSVQPTSQPSSSPSRQPSAQPTGQPSTQPTSQPSNQPSSQPSAQPSVSPTTQPSSQPSGVPTTQPTALPSMQPSTQPSGVPTMQPSSQPTSYPSRQPSAQPSVQPSGQPTGQPTFRPTSSEPTSLPTSRPTTFPTTSRPSVVGETVRPSRFPTSSPSFDFDFEDDDTYLHYLGNLSEFRQISQILTFSAFDYKGLRVDGSCDRWTSYVDEELLQPSSTVTFVSMRAWLEVFDFRAQEIDRISLHCTDQETVRHAIDTLMTRGTTEFICAGNQWRIFPCNGEPVVCINCKLSCEDTEACPGESLVVNPCQSSCGVNAAAGSILAFEYGVDTPYPEYVSLPYISDGTETSLTIEMKVDSLGAVHCGAFEEERITTTFVEVRAQGFNNEIINTSINASVIISSLHPDTEYSILCFTVDLEGSVMPLEEAHNFWIHGETSCCRTVSLVQSQQQLVLDDAGEIDEDVIFTFELSTVPINDVLINITIESLNCSIRGFDGNNTIPSIARAIPSLFDIAAGAVETVYSFQIQGTPGCFYLDTTITSNDEYNNTAANLDFTIIDPALSKVSPPQIVKAAFGRLGSRIFITFSGDTNEAAPSDVVSPFACSYLLDFEGMDDSRCTWLDTQTLQITLGASATILVGGTITVLGGNITDACTVSDTNPCALFESLATTSVLVDAPANPQAPVVSLVGPRLSSICADIVLDATSSIGSGGRQWSSVEWSVQARAVDSNVTLLNTYMNEEWQDVFGLITVPAEELIPILTSPSVSFTLKLTNFLGASSSATKKVGLSKGTNTIPTVRIAGLQNADYFRWQNLDLFADADLSVCGGLNLTAPLIYRWSAYIGTSLQRELESTALDPRFYRLDPYTLSVDSTYTFQVVLTATTSTDITLTVRSSRTIFVGRSALVALITGGSERTVTNSRPILMDASGSYSLDFPNNEGFLFSWSCSVVSPSFGGECSGFFPEDESIWSVPSRFMSAGTYSITVRVTDSTGKRSQFTQTLFVLAISTPEISIDPPLIKYNAADKIVLRGLVNASEGTAEGQWTAASIESFNSTDIPLTPLSKSFSRGSSIFELSLAPNMLTPGQTFTFRLQAAYDASPDDVSLSAVMILINQPPSGGMLRIEPQSGSEVVDEFQFLTSQWVDDIDDYPLSYILSYYATNPFHQRIIKSAGPVAYVTTTLARGHALLQFSNTGVANVSDVYGSFDVATSTVRVFPLQGDLFVTVTELVQDATTEAVENALLLRNPTAVMQAVDAAVVAINSAGCDVPAECSSINRDLCTTTQDTCGECLNGYVGVSGHSNIPCGLPSELREIGQTCSGNSSCLTGYCAQGTGVCTDISKTCLGGCGGESTGECVLLNFIGQQIPSCSVLDPSCGAFCRCNENRFGSRCQFGPIRFSEEQEFREDLCESIQSTSSSQDVSTDVVRARAFSISSVLLDIELINDAALFSCSSALFSLIEQYPQQSCVGTTLPFVVDALSAVLQKGSDLPETVFSNVTEALTTLVVGCQLDSALNELPTVYSSDNLRIVSALIESFDAQTLSVPRTGAEEFENSAAASISVDPPEARRLQNDDTGFAYGVSLFEFTSNVRGNATKDQSSIGITIESTQYSDIGETESVERRMRRRLTRQLQLNEDALPFDVTLTLPNTEEIEYFFQESFVATIFCERIDASRSYTKKASCPDGSEVQVTCPKNKRGFFSAVCPGRQEQPRCTSFNGNEFVIDPDCELVSFSATETVCQCSGSTARRILQSSASTTSKEFSVTVVSIDDQENADFTAYPDILEVQRNAVIIPTLITTCVLFFVGLVFFGYWDKHEYIAIENLKASKTHVVRSVQSFFNSLIPEEFRPGPWKEQLWKRIKLEHSWVSAFAAYQQERGLRSTKWTLSMMKLLTFMLIATVTAWLIFADNGYCGRYENKHDCESESSFTGILPQACEWENKNDSCIFYRPDVTFTTIWIFAFITAIIAVPLGYFVELLLRRLFHLVESRRKQKHALSFLEELDPHRHKSADLKEYYQENDELQQIESLPAKLLKYARLHKIQASSDFALPYAETELVAQRAERYFANYGRRELAVIEEHWFDVDLSDTVQRNRYRMKLRTIEQLQNMIAQARNRAEYIKSELEYMPTMEQRESFLLKHFIVDLFKGHQRFIAARYFLGTVQSEKRSQFYVTMRNASILLLPIIFALLVYFVLFFEIDIGSRATDMWLIVVFVTLAEDIFILQPLKIWLKWVVLNSYVSEDAFQICVALKLRFATILNRRFSMMNDAHSLVQHFNPACRAARLFPDLAVSRFLISMNDYDVPVFHARNTPQVSSILLILRRAVAQILVLLTMMPYLMQDIIIDVIGISVINFLALSLYLLGIAALGAAITVLVVVAFLIWLRESEYVTALRKKKTRINRQEIVVKKYLPPAKPPRTNADSLVKINEDFDSKVLFKSKFKSLDEHDMLRLSIDSTGASPMKNQSGQPTPLTGTYKGWGSSTGLHARAASPTISVHAGAQEQQFSPTMHLMELGNTGPQLRIADASSPKRNGTMSKQHAVMGSSMLQPGRDESLYDKQPRQMQPGTAPMGEFAPLALDMLQRSPQASGISITPLRQESSAQPKRALKVPPLDTQQLSERSRLAAAGERAITRHSTGAMAGTSTEPRDLHAVAPDEAMQLVSVSNDSEVERERQREEKARRKAAKKSKKRLNRVESEVRHGQSSQATPASERDYGTGAFVDTELESQPSSSRRHKRRKERTRHTESELGGPGISSARRYEQDEVRPAPPPLMSAGDAVVGYPMLDQRSQQQQRSSSSQRSPSRRAQGHSSQPQFPAWHFSAK